MPELNMDNLDEEFNLPAIDSRTGLVQRKDEDDPVEIIKDNINRANEILDLVQDQMSRGNITARLVEVASDLINGITAAAKELSSDALQKEGLQLKDKMVKLKEREVVVKEKKVVRRSSGGVTNQNIIVSNREDLMKFIKGEENLPQLEE